MRRLPSPSIRRVPDGRSFGKKKRRRSNDFDRRAKITAVSRRRDPSTSRRPVSSTSRRVRPRAISRSSPGHEVPSTTRPPITAQGGVPRAARGVSQAAPGGPASCARGLAGCARGPVERRSPFDGYETGDRVTRTRRRPHAAPRPCCARGVVSRGRGSCWRCGPPLTGASPRDGHGVSVDDVLRRRAAHPVPRRATLVASIRDSSLPRRLQRHPHQASSLPLVRVVERGAERSALPIAGRLERRGPSRGGGQDSRGTRSGNAAPADRGALGGGLGPRPRGAAPIRRSRRGRGDRRVTAIHRPSRAARRGAGRASRRGEGGVPAQGAGAPSGPWRRSRRLHRREARLRSHHAASLGAKAVTSALPSAASASKHFCFARFTAAPYLPAARKAGKADTLPVSKPPSIAPTAVLAETTS